MAIIRLPATLNILSYRIVTENIHKRRANKPFLWNQFMLIHEKRATEIYRPLLSFVVHVEQSLRVCVSVCLKNNLSTKRPLTWIFGQLFVSVLTIKVKSQGRRSKFTVTGVKMLLKWSVRPRARKF